MYSRTTFSVVILFFLGACTQGFYTAKFNTESWSEEGKTVEGIVYYEPGYLLITHEFTKTVDKKTGKVIANGTPAEPCIPVVEKEEIVLMANLNEARVIVSDPGTLASGQLKVTLANGMMAGLDVTSTSKASDVIGSMIGDAGLFGFDGGVDDGSIPACNSSPRITEFRPKQLGSTQ